MPRLTDPVTSFQHTAVVTERGSAHVFGRSARAQARPIIDHAAHPDAREELREHLLEGLHGRVRPVRA